MTQIHEVNGSYLSNKMCPGLPRSQVLELLPDLTIPDDQAELLTEQGWCFLEKKETHEEIQQRVKICV